LAQSAVMEITGPACAVMIYSTLCQIELTVLSVGGRMISEDKKLTPDEARAGVKEGEELLFANCPCCSALLAVYIGQDKSAAVPEPTVSSQPDHL